MRSTILPGPDRDGHGDTVTVPALRGCITEGATFEEAVANAGEAIAVADEIDAPTPTLARAVA